MFSAPFSPKKIHSTFVQKCPTQILFFHIRNITFVNTFLQVRGAPAIGIAALLSLAVELTNFFIEEGPRNAQDLEKWCNKKLEHLITSRPTGVNLKIECSALKGL